MAPAFTGPTPKASEATLIGVLLALEHSLLYAAQTARGMAATHGGSEGVLKLLDASLLAHRSARDTLNDLLDRWHVAAPVAAGAYLLPVTPRDTNGALSLAIALEDRCAASYLDAVGKTTDHGARALCTQGVSEAAVRATRLRRASGITAAQASAPFPGR